MLEGTPGEARDWTTGAIAFAAAWLIRALRATVRLRHHGDEEMRRRERAGERFILAFWHRHLLLMPYSYRGRRISVLVSASRDGELIARTVARLGIDFEPRLFEPRRRGRPADAAAQGGRRLGHRVHAGRAARPGRGRAAGGGPGRGGHRLPDPAGGARRQPGAIPAELGPLRGAAPRVDGALRLRAAARGAATRRHGGERGRARPAPTRGGESGLATR